MYRSAREVLTLILPILLFFVVRSTRIESSQLKKMAALFLVSFFCVLGYLLIINIYSPYTLAHRLTFRGYHPNIYAGWIAMVFSMLVVFIGYQKSKFKLLLVSLAILVSLICLFFTFSRSAWLAIIFVIIWLFWTGFKNKNKKQIIVLLAICMIFLTTFCLYIPFEDRFKSITSKDLPSNYSRIVIYKTSLSAIKEFPLFGLGPKGFRPFFVKLHPNYFEGIPHAHNNILQIAAEFGLLGLLAFCLMIWAFIKKAASLCKKLPIPQNKILSDILICWFIIWLTQGMTGYTFAYFSPVCAFILVLASLESISSSTLNI